MKLNNIKTNKTTSQLNIKVLNKKKSSGKIKQFFMQISRGLMLPIAILPIAGLLLGIGGAIGANVATEAGKITADIFTGMSEFVFGNLGILFAIAITITFSKDRGSAGFAAALAYLAFSATQRAFIQFNGTEIVSILWFHTEITGITTTTLGFTTLQTSIFGGVLVGGITAYIYNKISILKLPTALDFFSGIRLVPIILIPAMQLLALVFLIFWPWIGLGILKIGEGISFAPAGTGGLLYGMLGRSLMPFGLHHIPIVLAFQTPFGGVLSGSVLQTSLFNVGVSDINSTIIMDAFASISGSETAQIEGDQNIWNFINGLPFNSLSDGQGGELPLFQWFDKFTGVYAGRFTQDYPTYLGVCIGIGAAMIVTAERKNRRDVSVVIGSAMLVSFLTGITEPLEFTFLFASPLLYYLIYVPISGFSYMFMELAGAHVGVGFSRGFIDLIIYGAIPIAKGTNFYWALVLALAEGLFVFFLFSFFIKKFDIATPGRKDNPMTLISKKQYNQIKNINKDQRILNIIDALGGRSNIEDVSACATRLRVSVKNSTNIKVADFIELGSKGSIIKDKYLQVIFGGEATIISDKINDIFNTESSNELINKDINKSINIEPKFKIEKFNNFYIYAPFDGKIVMLKDVPDELFNQGKLGKGIAIKPSSSIVNSPIDGWLVNIFHTKHAFTFQRSSGIQILMHLGIDTAKNSQKIFESNVQLGIIRKDNEITKINLSEMEKSKSSITPIVFPDFPKDLKIVNKVKSGQIVKQGDPILEIIKK